MGVKEILYPLYAAHPYSANRQPPGVATMPKTIYLANPYGFSAQQRELLLPPLIAALEELGLEVWEPFARNNQVDLCRTRLGISGRTEGLSGRASSPMPLLPLSTGCRPDEGVMVELGMAIALGKPTFLFRDDFRRATDSEEYPLNLMLFTGLPEEDWRDYYYMSPMGGVKARQVGMREPTREKAWAPWGPM